MPEKKFNDRLTYLSDFGHIIIVKCPKCGKPINYKNFPDNSAIVATMSCLKCGYIRNGYEINIHKNPYAVFFQDYENYLTASCCGEELWAYNLEHLDFLENYVGATIRSRVPNFNKSLASRLPQWLKEAKNRKEILKIIARLKEKYAKDLK